MDSKWQNRFEILTAFGWMAVAGFALLLIGALIPSEFRILPLIIGACLFIPAFVYGYIVVIWHWKDRYRGNHSDLWGALIIIETSGWMKLVYVFRHIMPDIRNTGRYHRPPAPPMQYL